jgi:hypothetical protein
MADPTNTNDCGSDCLARKRLDEIGNMAILGAQQNSERLSSMMGIRAAQTNPIEAAAIQTLKSAGVPENGGSNALVAALAAIMANLAHITPATQAPPAQPK